MVHHGQFYVFWRPCTTNYTDYFTKHHLASHHQAVHTLYLHQPDHNVIYLAYLPPNCNHPGNGVLMPQVTRSGHPDVTTPQSTSKNQDAISADPAVAAKQMIHMQQCHQA